MQGAMLLAGKTEEEATGQESTTQGTAKGKEPIVPHKSQGVMPQTWRSQPRENVLDFSHRTVRRQMCVGLRHYIMGS